MKRPLSVYELGWIDLHSIERPQIIAGFCTLDGEVSIDFLQARLQEFTSRNTQYRCSLQFSPTPSWKLDSNFELARHIWTSQLACGDLADVLSYISKQLEKPLPNDQPPWKVLILCQTGGHHPAQTTLAFFAHHSLTDGLGARRFFESILDHPSQNRESEAEAALPNSIPRPRPRTMNGFRFGLRLARDFSLKRHADPFRGTPSSNRKVSHLTGLRKEFQRARKGHLCSLQELLLLIITRGLQRYCRRKGKFSVLRAIVPMADVRAGRGDRTTVHHDIGYVELPLNAPLEEQIQRLREEVQKLQQRQSQDVFSRLTWLIGRLPRPVRYLAAQRWSSNANLLISLVPGGSTRSTIDGRQVTAIHALPAVAPGQALAVGIFIAKDQIHLTVIVDPNLVPDYESLDEDLHAALSELLNPESSSIIGR